MTFLRRGAGAHGETAAVLSSETTVGDCIEPINDATTVVARIVDETGAPRLPAGAGVRTEVRHEQRAGSRPPTTSWPHSWRASRNSLPIQPLADETDAPHRACAL
jgi:hypothetical protein